MSLIDEFIRLSEIDTQRLALERRIAQTPAAAKEGEGRARDARAQLATFKEDAKKATLEVKRLEAEAKAKQQELEKTQVAQNQAKGNEEFKLLGKKIETLRGEIGDIEMRLLEEYERADHRGSDQAAIEAKVRDAEKEAAALNKEAEAKLAALRAELAKVQEARGAVVAKIDPQALALYDSALAHHGDRAVASVQGTVCQGCFITIRPQQISLLRGREQLVTCWQCNRILYLETMPAAGGA